MLSPRTSNVVNAFELRVDERKLKSLLMTSLMFALAMPNDMHTIGNDNSTDSTPVLHLGCFEVTYNAYHFVYMHVVLSIYRLFILVICHIHVLSDYYICAVYIYRVFIYIELRSP